MEETGASIPANVSNTAFVPAPTHKSNLLGPVHSLTRQI